MRYLSNAVHILGGCTLRTRERLVSKETAVLGVVLVVKRNTTICNQTITSWWGSNAFHREETTKLTPRALALKTSVLYPFHGGYLILIDLFLYKAFVFHFFSDKTQHFLWKWNLFAQCLTIINCFVKKWLQMLWVLFVFLSFFCFRLHRLQRIKSCPVLCRCLRKQTVRSLWWNARKFSGTLRSSSPQQLRKNSDQDAD